MRESMFGFEPESGGGSAKWRRIASDARFSLRWVLAIGGAVAALAVFLAARVRSIDMAYELGREHSRLSRLREVKRVLELEVASYETPDRLGLVAGRLLGMAPASGRVVHVAAGVAPARQHTGREPARSQPLAELATAGVVTEGPGGPLR